jgi:hypothetical protein
MVVSIDKITTLRMHEKVRAEWESEKRRILQKINVAGGTAEWASNITAPLGPTFSRASLILFRIASISAGVPACG